MTLSARTAALPLLAAALATLASPAIADDHAASQTAVPAAKRTVMPETESGRSFFEQYGFSEAVIHNGTVYLSGVIVGPPPEGFTLVDSFDRTFAYLGTVLARAGSSWDDVIDMTTFHTDIDASMPALVEAKNKVIKAPFPAWTAVDIDRLFVESGLVEIKLVARVTPTTEEE